MQREVKMADRPFVGVDIFKAYLFERKPLPDRLRKRPRMQRGRHFRLYLEKFKKITQVQRALRYGGKPDQDTLEGSAQLPEGAGQEYQVADAEVAVDSLQDDDHISGIIAGGAYQGNRAPLVIGSHLESWNGGVYLKAVEDTVKEVCGQQDVQCVSFKQLADWLDLQDPKVLDRLRGLDVGQAPKGGWNAYLRGAPATAAKR